MSSLRSRTSSLRVLVAVLVVGFGAMGFAGGLWSTPSAEPTVQAFLLAWQDHQYQTAAALTTGQPDVVAGALRTAYRRLDAASYLLTMGPITQRSGIALAKFGASVDLGQDGAPWNYQGQFMLRQEGGGWKIVWSPSVINPHLRPGLRLAVVSSTQPRAQLLDATGGALQYPSPTYVVGVRPERLRDPAATANALGKVAKLDPTQLLGWILAAPRQSFLELVVLRPQQYLRLAHRLSRVPGLLVRPEERRLFSSIAPAIAGSVGTEVSATLRDQGIAYHPGATIGLSGLQRAYQSTLAGTPTTKVVTETSRGSQVSVLAQWAGRAPKPVRTTIDPGVQNAAQSAADAQLQSAAVVAVQAPTGHILAVARHTAPGGPGIDPLAGHYAPGRAFTIVSTEALLASGLRVSTQVPCPRVLDVGGRIFRNIPAEPNFGSKPAFTADFAHACGTAFSSLSRNLSAGDLSNAASEFGLGSPWHLPLTGFPGSVQPASNVAGLAGGTLGEDGIKVSPLAMALVAAQVDNGRWHAPSLVTGQAAAGQGGQTEQATRAERTGFSRANLITLRALMRGVVRSGAATRANLAGERVYGQVGTVALHIGKHRVWASWFVGYRGNVAFAAVQMGSSPATSAVPLAAQFLTASPG